MIALLTGTPTILEDSLVLDVNGVGYGLAVGHKTLQQTLDKQTVQLHIYTHVREEALELYGFATLQDKRLFLLLLTVSGIGPRTALAITDKGATAITTAVQQADVSFFSSVPRVGKKLAQKIIIELTSKLGSLKELNLQPLTTFEEELSTALVSLGFSEQESAEIVRLEDFSRHTLEEALQSILKKQGRKK